GQWVGSLKPALIGPLIAIAIGSISVRTWRTRKQGVPMDEYPRMSLLWLLPLLGLLGWVGGLTYPYYRFFNTTTAIMLLTGMGAWVAVRWTQKRNRAVGVVVAVLILAGFGFIMARGFGESNWNNNTDLTARFLDSGTRSGLAAAQAYIAANDPDTPVVFVVDYRHGDRKAWGWAKSFSNVARSGLEGDEALRTAIYFGDLDDFLAGQPTGHIKLSQCKPVPLSKVYDCVSAGFFDEMKTQLAPYQRAPIALLVDRFNVGSLNAKAGDQYPHVSKDVAIITGPNLAPVDQQALAAGHAAGVAEARALASPAGRFSDPLHILRVLLVLAFLLVVPGLIAMRWFQLDDFPSRFALVPGISFAMTITAAFFVKAAHRTPFSVADGVASIVVACGAAFVLHLLARRRDRGKAVLVPFARRSVSLFQNAAFGTLMGAVFLAVLGDGIVQGALAKTIAFGGKAGFSLDEARSPEHIITLVLLTYLPYMLISPFMGVIIDRFERRFLLTLANGVRAGVILVIGLFATSLPDPVLIVALILTLASTRLVLAIKSAGMPTVLGGRDLLQGNSISQAGQAVFQLIGAGIAVVGTKKVSATAIIVLGAVAYGIGAMFAARTRHLAEGHPTTKFGQEVRRILHDIVEGVRQIRKRPAAALGVTSFLTLRTLVSFGALVFALQARDILGGKSSNSAVIIAGLAATAGAVLGFVVAQVLKDKVAPPRLIVGGMVVAGIGFVALGGAKTTAGLSVVAFVAALSYFVGKISADTIMQQSLPDEYRGRGFSFFDVAYNLAWILAALVLLPTWGGGNNARVLMISAGVLFLLGGLATLMWYRRLGPDAFVKPTGEPEVIEVESGSPEEPEIMDAGEPGSPEPAGHPS
ncbi:MAG TPA: MFS transporter, partial [Actinomycetota bacterium]|nr:MFS transporter [Actinomycetota bacterium]